MIQLQLIGGPAYSEDVEVCVGVKGGDYNWDRAGEGRGVTVGMGRTS